MIEEEEGPPDLHRIIRNELMQEDNTLPTSDADTMVQLGLDDSLDLLEVVMAIEEAYDIIIPDEQFEKWETVGDARATVTALTETA